MATPAQPASAAAAAPAASAAPTAALSEKEQKERALLERLDKRGTIIAGCMRKFIANYWTARQQMLDAARAAELAKLARKGKKGKKKKAAKPEKAAKAGDKKKVVKTPVQEAWAGFFADLDEKINKQKRCTLEDLYRGSAKLQPLEQRALACICIASNNKKVLPTEGQNANSMNMRQALFAAAAAFDVAVEKATLSASSGLALVSQRGASEQQMKEFGFKESDMLRAGCSRPDVIALAVHRPDHLHAAGVPAREVLASDANGGLAGAVSEPEQHLASARGALLLKEAGYAAEELLEAGVHTPYDLRQAGYGQDELQDAGVPAHALRAAGYGDPLLQDPSYLAATYRPLCHFRAHDFPPNLEGTQTDAWRAVMASSGRAAPGAAAALPPGRKPAGGRLLVPTVASTARSVAQTPASVAGTPVHADGPGGAFA